MHQVHLFQGANGFCDRRNFLEALNTKPRDYWVAYVTSLKCRVQAIKDRPTVELEPPL
jgi:hypothetical protein